MYTNSCEIILGLKLWLGQIITIRPSLISVAALPDPLFYQCNVFTQKRKNIFSLAVQTQIDVFLCPIMHQVTTSNLPAHITHNQSLPPTAPPKAKPGMPCCKDLQVGKAISQGTGFCSDHHHQPTRCQKYAERQKKRGRRMAREKKREWGECEEKIEKQRWPEEKVCRLSNGIRKGQVFAAVAREAH